MGDKMQSLLDLQAGDLSAEEREDAMEVITQRRIRFYFLAITIEYFLIFIIAIIVAVHDSSNITYGLPPDKSVLISASLSGDFSRSLSTVLFTTIIAAVMTYMELEYSMIQIILFAEVTKKRIDRRDFVSAMKYVKWRRIQCGAALIFTMGIVAFDSANPKLIIVHVSAAFVVWILLIRAQAQYLYLEQLLVKHRVFESKSMSTQIHFYCTIACFIIFMILSQPACGFETVAGNIFAAIFEYGIMVFGFFGFVTPTLLLIEYQDKYDFSPLATHEPFLLSIAFLRTLSFLSKAFRVTYTNCRAVCCANSGLPRISTETFEEQTVTKLFLFANSSARLEESRSDSVGGHWNQ